MSVSLGNAAAAAHRHHSRRGVESQRDKVEPNDRNGVSTTTSSNGNGNKVTVIINQPTPPVEKSSNKWGEVALKLLERLGPLLAMAA